MILAPEDTAADNKEAATEVLDEGEGQQQRRKKGAPAESHKFQGNETANFGTREGQLEVTRPRLQQERSGAQL